MTEFDPNLVTYGDLAGLGLWEDGHYRQHLDYAGALGAAGIVIADYPLLQLVGLTRPQLFDWLNAHELLHAQLRAHAGFTGTDLSQLDMNSPDAWMNWELVHAYEHQAFDLAFARYGLGNYA